MLYIRITTILLSGLATSALMGCGDQTTTPSSSNELATVTASVSQLIKLNQIGFLPTAEKLAVVPNVSATEFTLINVDTNAVILTGTLGAANNWLPADESVKIADFSAVQTAGSYRIEVQGVAPSSTFSIGEQVLSDVHDAAIKAYYYNRASTELLPEQAGVYARAAGHADTNVMLHSSAASDARPEGTIISAPKGWYDAGDYGKYVVNSGITTYTLLAAFEHFPQFYTQRNLAIPESLDNVPDILDEVKWNLDWLLAMQDPNDGGVYHKLTTLRFSGIPMPADATAQRYVVQKGTAAALNFSAVMAVASRIYAAYDSQFPGLAQNYQQAAISSWQWAQQHQNVPYQQPSDVSTGAYGDRTFTDEFSWAAAELYLLTEDDSYLQAFKQFTDGVGTPSWANTSALGIMSLLANGKSLLPADEYQGLLDKMLGLADSIVAVDQQSAYRVAMAPNDFVWGSNAVALNKAIMVLQAYGLTQQAQYKNTAQGLVDYVLGKNPTDYSYVTGFGHKTPMDIHHRPSKADDIVAPVPGFIAGGAQPGQQDKCSYPSKLAAKSYVDDYCSYSTNEIAINWNAPLVYVLAGLQAL
ncbi:glycoside hydrolase family 9 protein [Alteromonadaceae bacterium BrNp21-10]|nr:glycoside hydrolase family 9 protein [Alteromonadaceae bacterium BrNp21-10]